MKWEQLFYLLCNRTPPLIFLVAAEESFQLVLAHMLSVSHKPCKGLYIGTFCSCRYVDMWVATIEGLERGEMRDKCANPHLKISLPWLSQPPFPSTSRCSSGGSDRGQSLAKPNEFSFKAWYSSSDPANIPESQNQAQPIWIIKDM